MNIIHIHRVPWAKGSYNTWNLRSFLDKYTHMHIHKALQGYDISPTYAWTIYDISPRATARGGYKHLYSSERSSAVPFLHLQGGYNIDYIHHQGRCQSGSNQWKKFKISSKIRPFWLRFSSGSNGLHGLANAKKAHACGYTAIKCIFCHHWRSYFRSH